MLADEPDSSNHVFDRMRACNALADRRSRGKRVKLEREYAVVRAEPSRAVDVIQQLCRNWPSPHQPSVGFHCQFVLVRALLRHFRFKGVRLPVLGGWEFLRLLLEFRIDVHVSFSASFFVSTLSSVWIDRYGLP